jgi:transposase InsO family protein
MLWARLLRHLNESVNDSLIAQNQLLKAQIRELQRHLPPKKRFIFSAFCKLEMGRLAKQLTRESLEEACLIVRPSTLLKWYRALIASKFDGSKNRLYPGRPRIRAENENLILEIASKNSGWGAKRIQGALAHIGITLSHQTILNVLARNGLHPSPSRDERDSWSRFIKTHMDVTVATDFFSQEVLTARGLVTFYILFFIDLGTRQVKIAGITNHPDEAWMLQMARNITMDGEPFYMGKKYLIHDRDTKYCTSFRRTLLQAGIKPIKLPVLSPNLNAYAERWVRSIKTECLNHLILIGKRSLEKALSQYTEHYNRERTHQGIRNQIPGENLNSTASKSTNICHHERLGGLLSYYYRSH